MRRPVSLFEAWQFSLRHGLTFLTLNDCCAGTTQACLFRDNYTPITGHGLLVYGLSNDSPKSNTTFATKQSLPFPLLCDPSASLTGAIGMKKAPKSTTRGVVIIDKQGTVKVWEQAGPQKTVDAVMAYIQSGDPTTKEAVTGAVGGGDTKMEDAPASTDAHTAVTSTDAAPATDTEMMPATNNGAMPAASSEMVPPENAAAAPPENAAPAPTETATESTTGGAVSGGFATSAPENAPPLARADTQPHTDEIPITKFPSGEEMRSADTAAEVSESAAKVDSPDMEKAPVAEPMHTA